MTTPSPASHNNASPSRAEAGILLCGLRGYMVGALCRIEGAEGRAGAATKPGQGSMRLGNEARRATRMAMVEMRLRGYL